jgi:G3E family GTPase
MLENLPDEVIRAKGIVRFKETPDEFFIFQKVDRSDTPQFFPAGKTPRVNTPLILFIGPELPEDKLRDALLTLES